MDINYLILIALCIAFVFITSKLSELDAKISIVLSQSNIAWEDYFNEAIHQHILKGDLAKAAMTLRKRTGLPLNECLKIIRAHIKQAA